MFSSLVWRAVDVLQPRQLSRVHCQQEQEQQQNARRVCCWVGRQYLSVVQLNVVRSTHCPLRAIERSEFELHESTERTNSQPEVFIGLSLVKNAPTLPTRCGR